MPGIDLVSEWYGAWYRHVQVERGGGRRDVQIFCLGKNADLQIYILG